MKEMSYIADKFEELGVVPVVVLENTKDALPLAKALMEGGLPCAEVTFRTEAAQAVKKGLKVVKFFPAEQAGGIDMIKAMAAPYHELRFMPTGGINPNNLEKYLTFNKILCCGGSWMVKGNLVKAGDFDKIQELTKEAKELAKSIR